jgi:A/G-specific adenine glycosylase
MNRLIGKAAGAPQLTGAILRWYGRRGRRLPWRRTRVPYRILVSEIMLQQTQVSRVMQMYAPFLRRFPTLRSLAQAERSEVVIAWRGLGYNNRAVRLHALARTLDRRHRGRIPADASVLASLPGIGRYTAHALLVAVHGHDAPVVDVNVRRLLSRIFWRMQTTADLRPEREIWDLARTLVVPGRGYDWTQALMDLGATVCTARVPSCAECPVTALCRSAPAIRQVKISRRRTEPSQAGVPNRIYRGRVIELLRAERGTAGLAVARLGRRIFPRYTHHQEAWLGSLLEGLRRDGLIRILHRKPFHRTRVSLA